MGFFTRKTKKEKLNDQYKKKLEQAYKMSTSNRTESDRLTAEANEILEEIKKLEGSPKIVKNLFSKNELEKFFKLNQD